MVLSRVSEPQWSMMEVNGYAKDMEEPGPNERGLGMWQRYRSKCLSVLECNTVLHFGTGKD